MNHIAETSRRDFLKTTAITSGGLLMGVSLTLAGLDGANAAGTLYTPNAWVHIADDNTITLISARSEMGQGVYTSMPMLLAEELNVDLAKIKVAIAPPNAKLYGNPLLGGAQLTGGSTSVRDGWEKLRIAGAQVREMLISAAAARWKVDRGTLKAQGGVVSGPGGKKATYGNLAADASKLPVPEKVAIKDPKDFRIVGKRTRRLDTPAKVNGTASEDVAVQTTFLGGGFGRRIDLDFIVQAAQISKAVGKPVKLVWSREDDMTHDFYRPQALHQLAAALGPDGKPTAMTFRITSRSVTGRVFGLPNEVPDDLMMEAAVAPYEIPAIKHDAIKHDAGLRVGYWRSVSHLLNAFANESFVDELAKTAGKDPYEYRMSMLGSHPRHAHVLKIAADKAGWGKPLPAGHAHGIALMEGYDTCMAQVAEVSMERDGVKVHRVTVAADLGRMVNPDTVEAQIQSSIAFGMGAALMQEITLVNGRVQQTNFDKFPVVRMSEAPAIDIVLVESNEKPGGIGEPATAVVVPAVANAVAALTGKRVRKLPMTAEAIKSA